MSVDTLGRRSRFKRTKTGKHMVLVERDMAILCLLYRYRFLRTSQLIAFLQPKSEKRFVERLGDLFHEVGLIDRPKAQWKGINARYCPMIYELSLKGQRYLMDRDLAPHRVTSLARRGRPGATPHFDHAMMIVDVLAYVELQAIVAIEQRFAPVDEILARAPETTQLSNHPLRIPVTIQPGKDIPKLKYPFETHIIPDGLYGIEYLIDGEKRYRFWALECENHSPAWRSTPFTSSLALKRAAYAALIRTGQHRKVWGIPNLKLHVCTVKDVETMRQSLINA